MIALEQVRQRDLIQGMPHPLLQRLPERPQGTSIVMDTIAFRLRTGMALTVARVVEQRLAKHHENFAQAYFCRSLRETIASRSTPDAFNQSALPQHRKEL